MKKTGRLLIALTIVFFLDVLIFGLTGLSILLNYTIGGVIIWLGLSWAVAVMLPFWRPE